MELEDHSKTFIQDKEFVSDVRDENLERKSILNVFAVKRIFTDVNFKQSEFSECYFRNCRFIRCDFTGAKVSNSNFRGSQYEECKFQYTTWENTQLDEEFLSNCLPSEENIARDLVRNLRVNYGHIGNYQAVNKAAAIEVGLTGKHLFNAAYSKQSYYRSKYKGLKRLSHAIRHLQWKSLDLLWGNGESIVRVLATGTTILVLWSATLAWFDQQLTWPSTLSLIFKGFFGVATTPPLPDTHLVALSAFHLVFVGLFLAILIKQLARR